MHSASYSTCATFKLLGLACECPVLLFDALSVATCLRNGYYFAGEGGVDESLSQQLGGVAPTSSSLDPATTMMVFNDDYGPIPYNTDLAKYGWTPDRVQCKAHEMTHWFVVLARCVPNPNPNPGAKGPTLTLNLAL